MPKRLDRKLISWASDLDDKTVEQARRTANLPFVDGHVALMPDAHYGLGATIGSVIPTKGAIVPAAVGVDIGCGMIAAQTSLSANDLPDKLGALHGAIRRVVPAGVGKGHVGDNAMPASLATGAEVIALDERQTIKANNQFGSLGSGNHFVEVCLDEADRVWVVLHSGSRGIGNELATKHIECARGLMQRYFVELEDRDLAYLVEGTDEFDRYIAAMLWAQSYAFASRQRMLDAVLRELFAFVGHGSVVDVVNAHHNFTEKEHHDGRDVWLTRKGAIRARVGDRGVIPGSMGTGSYIVSGLGNPESYCSCSHGAGRRLSRSAARKTLSVESLHEKMVGKTWDERSAEALL
ncbi:MAG: RtcB family protein, partial [Acidimicrobiales bacterium]|nr:RtcB family protein [Acidimicrobiales bacterium]